MANTNISIPGMTCSGCVHSVTRALQSIEGVQNVDVSLDQNRAAVTYDDATVTVAVLKSVIEEAGYEVVDG